MRTVDTFHVNDVKINDELDGTLISFVKKQNKPVKLTIKGFKGHNNVTSIKAAKTNSCSGHICNILLN